MAFPRKKKRPLRSLLSALLFIVAYFLLFPYTLGRELVAIPRWAVALPSTGAPSAGPSVPPAPAAQPGDAAAAPFQIGGRFGYVTADGSLSYLGTALYRVALSSSGFVNFSRLGTNWIVQGPDGRRLLSFSGSGYPLLGPDGARIFTVKADLSGLREMDRGGEMLWERDFPTLMTSLSVQADLVLVGLLDGSLHLLNRQGLPVLDYAPGGSRIPVVVGCAVSPDGSQVGAISGIDPQRLTVLSREGSGFSPSIRFPLPGTFRREPRIGFSPDSRLLYLEGPSGPGLVDAGSGGLRWIPLGGSLAGVAFPARGRAAAFASRDGATGRLVIEPAAGTPVCREEFPARELFVGSIDGQLLLGLDGQLLRIDVEAM